MAGVLIPGQSANTNSGRRTKENSACAVGNETQLRNIMQYCMPRAYMRLRSEETSVYWMSGAAPENSA